jgi:SpoVK/Ycf46/Vps4 family AAA+-type ATPase
MEIFDIYLSNLNFSDIKEKDIPELSSLTEGYTGAEIEALIQAGLWIAHTDNGRNLCMDDLKVAIEDCIPLSTTMKEAIDRQRAWAKSRARQAGSGEIQQKFTKKPDEKTPVEDEEL